MIDKPEGASETLVFCCPARDGSQIQIRFDAENNNSRMKSRNPPPLPPTRASSLDEVEATTKLFIIMLFVGPWTHTLWCEFVVGSIMSMWLHVINVHY
mmetsp:Transcript_33729/g.81200  ORF Transcript_33729/g.81200 Transcript_33729/m.81200 type:complete len:98 (+) Transcript_33729:166-459(+)